MKAQQKQEQLMQHLQKLQDKKRELPKSPRKNATSFKEIVLNIDKHHTIKDIEIAYKKVQEAIPKLREAHFINIAIHRDEGHFNEITDEPIVNYHAHLLLNNIDKNNKTIFRQLTKDELSKIQDIMSDSLQMERGTRGSNQKHKTKWQLKHQARESIKKIKEMLPQVENALKQQQINQEQQKYYYDFIEWYLVDRKITMGVEDTRKKLRTHCMNNTLESWVEKWDRNAISDYKIHLIEIQREKEKQKQQSLDREQQENPKLEQKQEQSLENPELIAKNYIGDLMLELENIANNQNLSEKDKREKGKVVFQKIHNYSKKLKNADPATYKKISDDGIFGNIDIIEFTREALLEIDRVNTLSLGR